MNSPSSVLPCTHVGRDVLARKVQAPCTEVGCADVWQGGRAQTVALGVKQEAVLASTSMSCVTSGH